MPGRGQRGGRRRGGFRGGRGGGRGGDRFRARRGGRGGSFRKGIHKPKLKTEEAQIRHKDKLDKQLAEYWGEKPEVVQHALDKELEEYMAAGKKEGKEEEKEAAKQE